MTISAEMRPWLPRTPELTDDEVSALEGAMDGLIRQMNYAALPNHGDDRMADLEGAIVRYLILCRD